MGQLPPGLYDLTEVMRALPMLSMQVPGAEDNPYLDEPTRVALEQRILKLLTERTRQTT